VNHHRVVDQDLIGQYRAGTLTAGDAEAFEAHMIGCAECQSLLDIDQRLEQGLRTIAARVASTTPPTMVAAARWRNARIGALAAATVMLVAFAVPWLTSQSFDTAPPADLPLFQLALTRGASDPVTELVVPADAEWFALELEAPVSEARRCRVVIATAAGATVWQHDAAIEPDTGVVRVLLNRDHLASGRYLIALRSIGPGAPTLIEHRVQMTLDR
jgi:hypothetical protein